jgi:glycosyltransferase involved in cell wall biosynthesis
MTRILMTADAVGGVWTYALELCRALAGHDVEVALATMGDPPTAAQLAEAAALANLTVHVSRFRLEWMSDPWPDVGRAGAWLLELERRTRPDVIHLNGYVHAALNWSAPVLVVGHSCVLSWWAAVKNEPLPDAWLDYAARVSHGLHAADHVVAPSQAMLNCLRRHYRHLPPATVIHNGRRSDLFHAEAKKDLILSAGRLWDEAKNLQALNTIADRLPWPVVVAGETAPNSQHANVRCLGRLDEPAMAQWMSEAAIYALPAKYEPFGLSALEAALSGCALVLGDIPSLRELWDDAALFADPNDHEHLAAILRRCIEQPALRRQIAHRAGLRATRYTTSAMAEKYLNVYGRLLSEAAERSDRSDQTLQTMKG